MVKKEKLSSADDLITLAEFPSQHDITEPLVYRGENGFHKDGTPRNVPVVAFRFYDHTESKEFIKIYASRTRTIAGTKVRENKFVVTDFTGDICKKLTSGEIFNVSWCDGDQQRIHFTLIPKDSPDKKKHALDLVRYLYDFGERYVRYNKRDWDMSDKDFNARSSNIRNFNSRHDEYIEVNGVKVERELYKAYKFIKDSVKLVHRGSHGTVIYHNNSPVKVFLASEYPNSKERKELAYNYLNEFTNLLVVTAEDLSDDKVISFSKIGEDGNLVHIPYKPTVE